MSVPWTDKAAVGIALLSLALSTMTTVRQVQLGRQAAEAKRLDVASAAEAKRVEVASRVFIDDIFADGTVAVENLSGSPIRTVDVLYKDQGANQPPFFYSTNGEVEPCEKVIMRYPPNQAPNVDSAHLFLPQYVRFEDPSGREWVRKPRSAPILWDEAMSPNKVIYTGVNDVTRSFIPGCTGH